MERGGVRHSLHVGANLGEPQLLRSSHVGDLLARFYNIYIHIIYRVNEEHPCVLENWALHAFVADDSQELWLCHPAWIPGFF